MHRDILIVSSEFPPMPGGIGNHALCLAKELAALDHNVTVLTEQRESSAGEWLRFLSSNKELKVLGVRRFALSPITYAQRLINAYKLTWRSRWRTVIYSGKFSVWLNGIMPKARSIVVIHGSEIKQKGIGRFLFRLGLGRAKHVVCVSEYTRRQLDREYGRLVSGKLSVINNGIRNDLVAPSAVREVGNQQLRLVTIGSVHQRKGQANVVRALPRIRKMYPSATYSVSGIPLEMDRLLDTVNECGVAGHVIFHHGQNDQEVRELLRSCDVFMILSEHLENGDFEGFGIAVVEAMAQGLPAIGSKDSGAADAIANGYSGRLVDPRNIDDVVNALRDIVENYASYSANAVEAAKRAQWKYRIEEYRRLIDRL